MLEALRSPERVGSGNGVRWLGICVGWEEVFRVRWKEKEASNILETRMVVLALKRIGRQREFWGKKLVLAVDNLATLGVMGKGRSSVRALLRLARTAGALCLAYGFRLLLRWVVSKKNHADGPSRQVGLGYKEPGRKDEELQARALSRLGAS